MAVERKAKEGVAEERGDMLGADSKTVGDELSFGGLLGTAPVMEVNTYSPSVFVKRGGRIPAPIQSLKN